MASWLWRPTPSAPMTPSHSSARRYGRPSPSDGAAPPTEDHRDRPRRTWALVSRARRGGAAEHAIQRLGGDDRAVVPERASGRAHDLVRRCTAVRAADGP